MKNLSEYYNLPDFPQFLSEKELDVVREAWIALVSQDEVTVDDFKAASPEDKWAYLQDMFQLNYPVGTFPRFAYADIDETVNYHGMLAILYVAELSIKLLEYLYHNTTIDKSILAEYWYTNIQIMGRVQANPHVQLLMHKRRAQFIEELYSSGSLTEEEYLAVKVYDN